MNYILHINKFLSPVKKKIKKRVNYKRIFDYFIHHQNSLCFIQIGGYDGLSFDHLFSYFKHIHPNGIILEPIPSYFSQLKSNSSNYPDISLLNYAIHTSNDKMKMYKIKDEMTGKFPDWIKGCAGFSKSQLTRHGVLEEQIETLEVPCLSINSVFKQLENGKSLDYLQVDCEGYDGQIMLDLDLGIYKPKVIKFEHINLDYNELKDVRTKLRKHGYILMNEGTDTIGIRLLFFLSVMKS